jgi:hypothetical protein
MAIGFSQLKGQGFAKNLSLFIIVFRRMQVCLECCIFGMVVEFNLQNQWFLCWTCRLEHCDFELVESI